MFKVQGFNQLSKRPEPIFSNILPAAQNLNPLCTDRSS
jgi:hypothetical protein